MTETPPPGHSYLGFEQGPIRPPNEAHSLLLRVTRNCPWNRCTFCPVYKGARYSKRSVDHLKKDIDSVYRCVEILQGITDEHDGVPIAQVRNVTDNLDSGDWAVFDSAFRWFRAGMRSIFLQDADSLTLRPSELIEILKHIRTRFPFVNRVTSYSRSSTIARIDEEDLKAIKKSGLDRVHIGLESGSDNVLKLVKKGATKAIHVSAGLKAKRAGLELSEYVMPGLGGVRLSEEHALETADALNQINPDFIRLRQLAIPIVAPLSKDLMEGRFERCSDPMVAGEVLTLIENLKGITSVVKSDHILNLFSEVEGTLPEDKERMLEPLREFLSMESEKQRLYQIGRRIGVFSALRDMEDTQRMKRVREIYRSYGVTAENVDHIVSELMKRYI